MNDVKIKNLFFFVPWSTFVLLCVGSKISFVDFYVRFIDQQIQQQQQKTKPAKVKK